MEGEGEEVLVLGVELELLLVVVVGRQTVCHPEFQNWLGWVSF